MKDTAHLKGFGRVATHLIAMGVKDPDAFRFQHHVDRLIRTRGTKGALSWLDSLGNLFSQRVFKIRLPYDTWVSRKYYRIFKSVKSRVLLQRMTKIKRLIVERQITAQQAKKFLDAALRGPVSEQGLNLAAHYIRLGVPTLSVYTPKHHNWKAPSCFAAYIKRELIRGHSEEEAFEKATRKLQRDARVIHNLHLDKVKPIRDAFAPLSDYELFSLADSYVEDESVKAVGTIHCTQEPGGKLRVFAAPYLAFQSATTPLQAYLMDTLRQLPEDACFCEKPAVMAAQDHMQAGKVVIVRDLRNATDNAPSVLSWYSMSLDHNIPTEHIELLQDISEGEYIVSDEMVTSGHFPHRLRWTVGQPLGTKPSFGAFSHFHHSLMRGILVSMKKPLGLYRFKGDDYVCFDEDADTEYCRVCDLLGIPIPQEKCSVSSRHAEFAGQTILPTEAFYPGKWREVTEDSLWTFILDPAYDIEKVVPRLWARLIRRIKETPYPYGLFRPPLEVMDSHALSEFSRSIEELFLVQMLTSSRNDTLRPEWMTDRALVSKMLYHSDWPTMLYPDLHRDHPLASRQISDRKLFTAMQIWNSPDEGHTSLFTPHSGSPCRLFWEPSAVVQCLMTGFKYQSVQPRQVSRMRGLWMSLRSHEQEDVKLAASLIRSIIVNANNKHTPVWLWVDHIELLHNVYGNSLTEVTYLDLVHAVVSHFPHFETTDFNLVGTRFVSVLRKYSRPTEVMPQRTTPLPHLKRG